VWLGLQRATWGEFGWGDKQGMAQQQLTVDTAVTLYMQMRQPQLQSCLGHSCTPALVNCNHQLTWSVGLTTITMDGHKPCTAEQRGGVTAQPKCSGTGTSGRRRAYHR
jgi:hypothetical protein